MGTLNKQDQEILDLFSRKDLKERGFRLLMSVYKEKLYWHIYRMVNSHDKAEDLLQDVFMKIWQILGQFKGNSSLYTFLYRVCTNLVIDYLKKSSRSLDFSYDIQAEGFKEPISNESPDSQKIQEVLSMAIHSLPSKQQLVFNLRYFEEMPYQQMSEVLETSEGALKASYHIAVKKIEEFIRSN